MLTQKNETEHYYLVNHIKEEEKDQSQEEVVKAKAKIFSKQDILIQLVKLMPPIPYDFLQFSFHYTLLEDLVLICCSDGTSRCQLLGTPILKTTSLKSSRFWKVVKEITGMKRTLDSMISRYRNYWVNLHPIELFKFFPYLKERKFSYIIRIRRDIFDEMNYIDDICEKFYKCQVEKSMVNKIGFFGRKRTYQQSYQYSSQEEQEQDEESENLMEELNNAMQKPIQSNYGLAESNYFPQKRIIEKMGKNLRKYNQTIEDWKEAKERQLQSLKTNLQLEIRLIDQQLDQLR